MGATYAVAKAINVVLVSAAAVPVYLLGPAARLAGRRGRGGGARAPRSPSSRSPAALMQENLAFPRLPRRRARCSGSCLEEPTPRAAGGARSRRSRSPRRRGSSCSCCVAIVPTAVLLARASVRRLAWRLVPTIGVIVAIDRRSTRSQPSRLQDALQTFPRPRPGTASAACSGGSCGPWPRSTSRPARSRSSRSSLVTAARTPRRPAERAFLAVTWACLGWFLVIGGLSGSWEPYGLKERYVFYLQPLLLLGLVLWVERGARTRRLRFVLPVGVPSRSPSRSCRSSRCSRRRSLPGNALGMEVFRRLGNVSASAAGCGRC